MSGATDNTEKDADGLRATVDQLLERVRALEDQVEIMQLVAQYGPLSLIHI